MTPLGVKSATLALMKKLGGAGGCRRSGQEGHQKSCQDSNTLNRTVGSRRLRSTNPSRLGQLHQQTATPSVVRHARCRPSPDNGVVDGRKAPDIEVMAMTEAMVTFKGGPNG
jgi:hypothetical protein